MSQEWSHFWLQCSQYLNDFNYFGTKKHFIIAQNAKVLYSSSVSIALGYIYLHWYGYIILYIPPQFHNREPNITTHTSLYLNTVADWAALK